MSQLQADVYDPDAIQILSSLQEWHGVRIKQLEMIVNAMDDVGLQLRLPDGSYSELVGDERKGFQAGAATALDLFRKFPLEILQIAHEEV